MYQTLNHQAKAREVLGKQFECLLLCTLCSQSTPICCLQHLLDLTQISGGPTAKVQHGNDNCRAERSPGPLL